MIQAKPKHIKCKNSKGGDRLMVNLEEKLRAFKMAFLAKNLAIQVTHLNDFIIDIRVQILPPLYLSIKKKSISSSLFFFFGCISSIFVIKFTIFLLYRFNILNWLLCVIGRVYILWVKSTSCMYKMLKKIVINWKR